MRQRSFFDAEFESDMADKRGEAPDDKRRAALGFDSASAADLQELSSACVRVLEVLSDGEWHSAGDLIAQTGYTEATRRLRELLAAGHIIEKRGGGRAVEYRMNKG